MRTEQSIKNIIVALMSYCVTLILGFISRGVFAKILGAEYLGISGLFANIISVMSVVELGFGSAIIYNLYRPLSENNCEQIKSLIRYYKKVYSIIAIVVAFMGIVLTPLIPIIVGEITIRDNLYFIFLLFVIDSSTSYLLTYKRSIFYADQRNYVVNLIHATMYVFINVIQIAILIFLSNYVLFLVLQITLHLLENIVISVMADKKYSYLRNKDVAPLDLMTKNDIIQRVKGLFFHQIGSSIVLGTDNIIMSMTKSLGIIVVGKYSNYIMVINNLNAMMGQVFTSVTASIGNLIVEKDNGDIYMVYKNILFLNAAICNFICVSLFACIDSLVNIWVGEEYVLSTIVVAIIVINFYVQSMKRTCGIFKNAAGIFYEDRFVPFVEAIINLIASIVLVYLIGLKGIILGTIISSMIHWLYDFPKYVYGIILKKPVKQYVLDYVPYLVTFVASTVLTKIICRTVADYCGSVVLFFIDVVVCLIIPNLTFVLLFHNKPEFIHWWRFVTQKIKLSKGM